MLDLEQVARAIDDAVAPVTADEARARAGARTHFRRTAVIVSVAGALLAGSVIFAVLAAVDAGRHPTDVVVAQSSTTVNNAPTVTSSPLTAVPPGDPIGKMDIPAIDVHWVFVQGSRPEDEAKGPIHDPDSPMPGEDGNVVIAGHRTTHGAPFYRLDELKPGDVIQITTLRGGFTYIVDASFVVRPQGDPLFPENILERTGCGHGSRSLTLITNEPRYSAAQRLVVTARRGTEPVASCAE